MRKQRPVSARDAMRSSSVALSATSTSCQILAAMDASGADELPVAAHDGDLLGMVGRRAVERRLYDRGDEQATAEMIAEDPAARGTPDEPIENAIDKMLAADLDVLPILSPQDRLEGLLVLDDVREVPGLVDAVSENRRRREMAAGARAAKMTVGCGLASAAIGLALFALWVAGPFYGLPRWVAWVDGLAAVLAFVGAVSVTAREMFSVPVWTVAGIGLCFAAMNAHAWRDGRWATWLQLALGLTFLAMAAVIGAAVPRRHRRRVTVAASG
jgi:CBS domain-containing protein